MPGRCLRRQLSCSSPALRVVESARHNADPLNSSANTPPANEALYGLSLKIAGCRQIGHCDVPDLGKRCSGTVPLLSVMQNC